MMNCLHELKPALAMVVAQFVYAGVNVLCKIAANDGMKLKVIIAYRFIFATAFIFPLALFLERKSRPKLTWMILFQSFLCGLFGGSLAQFLYLGCLTLTSATFAAATTNLIPAITFILALSLGMEKLGFGDIRGKAKLLGSLLGIGGAAILTLYKGVELNIWSTHVDLLNHYNHHSLASPPVQEDHRSNKHILGCLLGLGSCICISLWLIVQAKMSERYPCPYTSTALMSTMSAIQTLIFSIFTEKDWSQWKLGWNIRLLTVAYSGSLASGLVVVIIAWCVQMRGPVFTSAFNPLMLVLVAIASSLVLNEKLRLGSVLAAVLIIIGLYLVLWGKSKEMRKKNDKKVSDELSMSIGGDHRPPPAELVHVVVAASEAENSDGSAFSKIDRRDFLDVKNISIVEKKDTNNASQDE